MLFRISRISCTFLLVGELESLFKDNDKTSIDEDDPLIDLNSPADTLDDKTSPVFLVDIANNDTKDMNYLSIYFVS